jgi:site-specific DNA recombinase
MSEIKYILYARKSTESEDKQVQSIDDQLQLMTEHAEKHGMKIVKKLKESRSAKAPNRRPEFARMLEMIDNGEATGILCWQLNRLSRNPTESGLLQQLLQDEKLLNI